MKVLLAIGRVTGGGAERQWLLLSRALLDQGHHVVLATVDDVPTPALEELVRRGLRWRVFAGRLFREGAGRPVKRVLGLVGMVVRLRVLIEQEQPDVVYSALTITNGAAWCATRLGHGSKLVWGIRATDEPYPHFTNAIERAVAAMARSVPLAIANSSLSVESHSVRGIRPRAWATIPNGFDTVEFRPDAPRRALARASWGVTGEPVVGCVARLVAFKEHPLLLRAFARVLTRVPNAVLVLAGGGTAAAEGSLRALATELGIADHVRFLGWVSDAATVHAGLDVHALASYTHEGLPNALGEAMATGVPCVGSDFPAISRLIADTGMVVPSADEGALADAVVTLFADPVLRARLGSAARQRIIDEYSPAALAARTVAAFEAAL